MHNRRSFIRQHPYYSRRRMPIRRNVMPVRETKRQRSTIKISDRVEEVQLLCREISSAVSNVEKWMNAVYNVSRAFRDKSAFKEMIAAISSLETGDDLAELKELPSADQDEDQKSDHEAIMQTVNALLEKIASGKK